MSAVSKQRIFIAIAEYGEFPEMLRVGRLLKAAGAGQVVFVFTLASYRTLPRNTQDCIDAGCIWMDRLGRLHDAAWPAGISYHEALGRVTAQSAQRRFTWTWLIYGTASRWKPLEHFVRCIAQAKYWRSRIAHYRRIIARDRPALVVIGQDFPESDFAPLLKAASIAGVKSLLVAYAIVNGHEVYQVLADNPEYREDSSTLNRLVGWIFPRWRLEGSKGTLLRLPGARILAGALAGLSMKEPWRPNETQADRIAIASEADHEFYKNSGFAASRLCVTGLPAHDEIAAVRQARGQLRLELARELGLEPSRLLILCAWPSDQVLPTRPNAEFGTYSNICKFWAETLAGLAKRHDANVVVRLHPKTDPAVARLVEQYDLKVSDRDAAELVPLCDILVGSVTSIIAWAIACGIPVVNYDIYRYRYSDFAGAPGVLTMEDRQGFRDALERLVSDPSYRGHIADLQQRRAADWARLDGHAGERLLDVVRSLGIEIPFRPRQSLLARG
jgi:glycosyltransferase involved in cell wall biosynthesis